ncbi:ABC transporter permease [Nocardia sp. NPDC051981]|uniref:galactan export ABC transporter permease subunit Wzm/RfbD n=1 Tax=Nocardia sp. NPDC051981 TaxID=3155417 RepID=UPI00341C6CB8
MSRAIDDLYEGFNRRELWLALGWQDIKQRYRRSVIGPFWISIATAAQAAAMGILYSQLLHLPVREMLPWVTVGLIVWNVVRSSIVEGSEVFISNDGLIKFLPAPLSVHVYRLVWRQLLFFMHNMVVYAIVVVACGTWRQMSWYVLLAFPAMILIAFNAAWVAIVFGILSTRYRDLLPIFDSLTLMLFVLTPVMWTTKGLNLNERMTERLKIAELVPTFHYLEIVRAPLIGDPIRWFPWVVVTSATVSGWAVALFMFRRYRSRIAYWV